MGRRPHVLIIPFPAQGHVTPLMKFAYQISDHGIKVTFVNSDFIHEKLVAALPDEDEARSRIGLASIPDGLGPGEDRKDSLKLTDSIFRVMPGHLKEFMEKVNNSNDDEKITCVIADSAFGWALEVADKMGIKRVAFCPFGPGSLALAFHIPRLIEAGLLNSTDGSLLNDELISLAKDIPAFSSNKLPWSCPSDPNLQKVIFQFAFKDISAMNLSNWLLCNSVYELDSSACDLIPNILPIGPLLANNHLGHYPGNFWPEDSTCISWLDKQPAGSVIYVAFGSLAILSQHQFNELALGIELVGRPFLWVVRSDFTNGSDAEYPDGFTERVAENGKIVSWAPQEKVLAHPSVACFLSHCGWNSTMDGIGMGVPFLCWPYVVDQFHNQSYICDKWKVGLGLNPDENGFISRHEIKKKIEMLVSDDGIKANVEKLKEMTRKSVSEGGSSYKNFQTFVEVMKQ
ncbi:UDP-glycosyltransferase 83A1-like isoform X1 [Vitis riparia]|uniref:UDP-glycosyltransferase 83A1-like isoform X1 n=1 Tax=Vitis riparia TaxID=96939 RepID=UPI00155AD740|nr:UDP-glycosyltransferase 83A1-like isoform X1 [Vitis riparia]